MLAKIATMFESALTDDQGCFDRLARATIVGAGVTVVLRGNLPSRRDAAMRVVWRGTISFGLVTIPVRLYAATESKNVPSHQIHVPDGGRVQYKRVCSIDGAEVPYEESGRGYVSTTGELVVLDDVDL